MRPISFKLLDKLCADVAAAASSPPRIDRLVGEAIRQGTLSSHSLPLVVQRLVGPQPSQGSSTTTLSSSGWCTALKLLQSKHVAHKMRVDETIWPIVDRSIPPQAADAREAAKRVLMEIYRPRTTSSKK